MKSIANQYRDLQEGRMSQFNFMRNLRMNMPQVTNTTSFGDAVKILKNKGIITEAIINEVPLTINGKVVRTYTQNGDKSYNVKYDDGDTEIIMVSDDGWDDINTLRKNATGLDEANQSKAEEIADLRAEIQALMDSSSQQDPEIVSDKIDDIKAKIEKLKAEKEKAMYANTDPNITDLINELSEVKSVNDSGKQEYKQFGEAENDNLNELIDGITIEHECFPTKTYDEIVSIVTKNLKKDPFYYTMYKLTGTRDNKPQTMDTSKPETHQMKYYTGKNAVDTAREMKKVKMPKKVDEKKKLKENVDEKMRFQDLPADPEKYKMVKDSKGKIIKATNADGIEFQRGDVVKAFDGEEIKIADFKEEQGKVKALYNKGRFFVDIDIDGLEAPKETFRPGVNIGGSFEKMKAKLAEMVKKAMAEFYDGRDNLTNISDDTK